MKKSWPSTMKIARGFSIVEVAVAMLVMGFGMLSIIGIQGSIRTNGDLARQTSEAVRLADEELERQRDFSVIPVTNGSFAWNDISTGRSANPIVMAGLNTEFTVSRSVSTANNPSIKIVNVNVSWVDRQNQAQSISVESAIAPIDPLISALVTQTPPSSSVSAAGAGRSVAIPLGAKNFGDGTSVYKPPGAPSSVAWIFNNATGQIQGACDLIAIAGKSVNDISVSDVAACANNTIADLVAGVIRFNLSWWASGAAADVVTANAVTSAPSTNPQVNLNLTMAFSSPSTAPAYVCYDDAPATTADRYTNPYISYACLVPLSSASMKWTGVMGIHRLKFSDSGADLWEFGNDSDQYRLCRYTPASNDSVVVDNVDHPLTYVDVTGSLLYQDFLMIRGSRSCPTDVAANPASGDFVDTNTIQHCPALSSVAGLQPNCN